MTDDAMDMTSKDMSLPSAALVVYDIYDRRHRQPNAAMNLVWPISALYLGPFGVWAYNKWGKTRNHRQRGQFSQPERIFTGKPSPAAHPVELRPL